MKLNARLSSLLQRVKKELRAFVNPYQYLQDDCLDVARASSLLQISEFQFFQLAYVQWFGRGLPERRMEFYFKDYLFDNVIPYWVRQLSRKVLKLHRQQRLDPADFNIRRPVATPEMRALGEWYIIMIVMIIVVFLIFLSGFEPY